MPTAKRRGETAKNKGERAAGTGQTASQAAATGGGQAPAGDIGQALEGSRQFDAELNERVRSGELSQDEAVKLFFQDFAQRAVQAGRPDLARGAMEQAGGPPGHQAVGAGPFGPQVGGAPEGVELLPDDAQDDIRFQPGDEDEAFMFGPEGVPGVGNRRGSVRRRPPPPEDIQAWLPKLTAAAQDPSTPPEVRVFLRRLRIALGLG